VRVEKEGRRRMGKKKVEEEWGRRR